MTFRSLVLFFSFLLLFQFGCSFVSVSLRPMGGSKVLELYPNEVGLFVTSVRNDGNNAVPKVFIRWEVSQGLAIVNGLQGSESSSYKATTVENLQPGEERLLQLKVKPASIKKGKSGSKLALSVSYGTESYDYYAGTYVQLADSPLKIEAKLKSKVIKPGGSGSVVLSVKNISGKSVRIESAGLVLPSYLFSDANSLLTETIIVPGQELSNREFGFSCEPSFVGNARLILRVIFDDASGRHVIERDFSFESRGIDYGLIGLIAIVLVLIVIVVYSKKKQESKPKP